MKAIFTGICGGSLLLAPLALLAATPEASSTATETVVVQGQKLKVETRIDRKVYSVPEEAQTALGSLSDILTVIPSIDVDPDGVVSLRGDSNVLILIDGKPASQLQGTKGGENLQSISARDIERVEVLTTPPAEYKAEGSAGVINIITRKRSARESALGSLQGSLGDGGRWLLGANGSYGSKKLTVSVNAGFREDYRSRTIDSKLIGPDPKTGQILESRDHSGQHIRRNVPNVGFSTEYDPTDHEALSASGNWLSRGGLRTYTQFDESTLASGVRASSTRRITSGHDPQDDYDGTLRFTHKFSKPGETLDLSAHRSISHQHEHYDYTNDSFLPSAPTVFNNLSFTEDIGLAEGGLDYALPLSKTRSLKLGYAFEQDDYGFNNVGENVDPATGAQTVNPQLTNNFKYRQRVHAVYLSDQARLGDWAGLAGLRTEWTTTDARLLTNNVSTPNRYVEVYPSLHVDRVLTERSTLSFGASRRITRPDPDNFNPYVDREYPPNFNAGNPRLKPQFTQSFELGYGYEGRGSSYSLTGYYRRNTDSVTAVTTYLGGGFSLTTKTNLPKRDAAGLEFTASGHLLPKLAFSLSGNVFYTEFDATQLGTPGLKSTTGADLKAKLDYRPNGANSAQLTLTRTDKRLTPQGGVSAMNIVNVGFRHVLSPALSAVATVSDLFNGQRYERVASTPTLTQVYQRHVAGRVAIIGLVYTVGVTKKDARQENFEYDSGSVR